MSLARREFLKTAAAVAATPYFFSSQKSLAAQAATSSAERPLIGALMSAIDDFSGLPPIDY